MSNLDLAFEALTYARQVIPANTSDNKKYLSTVSFDDLSVSQDVRLKAYEAHMAHAHKQQALHSLRGDSSNPQTGKPTIDRCFKYGTACVGRGIGNCLEYSCVVAKFLKGRKAVFNLITFRGGDHVFVAIGQPSPYPTSFAAWDPQAAICDAWADIACAATDFPARWRARMSNWDSIQLQLAQVGGGFISPTHAYWYDAVDNDKLSFTQ